MFDLGFREIIRSKETDEIVGIHEITDRVDRQTEKNLKSRFVFHMVLFAIEIAILVAGLCRMVIS